MIEKIIKSKLKNYLKNDKNEDTRTEQNRKIMRTCKVCKIKIEITEYKTKSINSYHNRRGQTWKKKENK